MVLDESRGQAPGGFRGGDIRILATDISRRVLRIGESGAFDDSRLADVPRPQRAKYFIRSPGDTPRWMIAPALRSMVHFRYLNLMDNWPFHGPFDLIFCRNVMIYFDRQTQQRLVERLWNCLRPHGVLITGHSESLGEIRHRFRNVQPSIYERV